MSSSHESNTSNTTVTRRQGLKHLLMVFVQEQTAQGVPPKGLEQAFAAILQISPSLLSQIKSSRPIGDKLARQIETACSKPLGYLDSFSETETLPPSSAEEAFIASARSAWRAANAKEKRELARQMKAVVAGKNSST